VCDKTAVTPIPVLSIRIRTIGEEAATSSPPLSLPPPKLLSLLLPPMLPLWRGIDSTKSLALEKPWKKRPCTRTQHSTVLFS